MLTSELTISVIQGVVTPSGGIPDQVCRDASWRKWRLAGWVAAGQQRRENQSIPGGDEYPCDSAGVSEKLSEGE